MCMVTSPALLTADSEQSFYFRYKDKIQDLVIAKKKRFAIAIYGTWASSKMHGLSEMDAMVSGILQEFVLVKKKKNNIKKKSAYGILPDKNKWKETVKLWRYMWMWALLSHGEPNLAVFSQEKVPFKLLGDFSK